MFEEEELFPYLPPLTPPRKSISKGFSASFKSGPVVTKIQSTDIFKMKRIEANNCEIVLLKKKRNWKYLCIFSTTSNFLATALRFYFFENLQNFNGGVQFSWKAPSVWKRFPWKAIQIFRARMRVSLLLFFLKQNIETVTLFVGASEA